MLDNANLISVFQAKILECLYKAKQAPFHRQFLFWIFLNLSFFLALLGTRTKAGAREIRLELILVHQGGVVLDSVENLKKLSVGMIW